MFEYSSFDKVKHHLVSKLCRSATWAWYWRKFYIVFYWFNKQRKEISSAFVSWRRERDAIGYSQRTQNIPYTWNIHNECIWELLTDSLYMHLYPIELNLSYLFSSLSNVWKNFLIKVSFILKPKLELICITAPYPLSDL